jgi:nucleotide-binding universal stress UspA family protein
MYNHMLIATDGSEVAQRGVDHGLSLAKALGAKVTIVTVTERFPMFGGSATAGWAPDSMVMADYQAGQQEAAEKVLKAAKSAAEKLGVAADTLHVPDAYPAETIVEVAKSRDCSLIVMSSHGRRGLQSLLLGSQTAKVLAESPVPVLVVH